MSRQKKVTRPMTEELRRRVQTAGGGVSDAKVGQLLAALEDIEDAKAVAMVKAAVEKPKAKKTAAKVKASE